MEHRSLGRTGMVQPLGLGAMTVGPGGGPDHARSTAVEDDRVSDPFLRRRRTA